MIITQTPFRMSFFGGGTDMESFFRENGGAVLSTTFDKYCYVNVRHLPRFFDYSTELSYSKTERVTCIEDIQHPAIRNAMKMLDIGNIGRLSEQKGMTYFIEAAEIITRTHPEARFIIVGDGEEREQLHAQIEKKKLQNKMLFLGYRNDIQNVMSQLDFVVLSSLWEGLPLTPIEAYSVGKTVIGTAVDGTPEIIRDGVDGYLVEPRNPVQLAEKMNELIENPEMRENMGIQAMKRYRDEFSFEKLSERYIAFYEGL